MDEIEQLINEFEKLLNDEKLQRAMFGISFDDPEPGDGIKGKRIVKVIETVEIESGTLIRFSRNGKNGFLLLPKEHQLNLKYLDKIKIQLPQKSVKE